MYSGGLGKETVQCNGNGNTEKLRITHREIGPPMDLWTSLAIGYIRKMCGRYTRKMVPRKPPGGSARR